MSIQRTISFVVLGWCTMGTTSVALSQQGTSNWDREEWSSDQGRQQQRYQRDGQDSSAQDGFNEQARYGRSRQQTDRYGQSQQRSQSTPMNRRQQPSAQRFIAQYDEDGNGRLSRQELPRRMSQQFEQLDRNDDGQLSQSELRQHAGRMAHRAIPVEITYIWITDAQRGRLDLNDLQQAYQLLQRIDQNNDGQLARQELQERREQVVSQWISSLVDRADENGDNEISQSEARGTLLSRRFDRFDRNQDGHISRNELRRIAGQGSEESYVREEARQREQVRRR